MEGVKEGTLNGWWGDEWKGKEGKKLKENRESKSECISNIIKVVAREWREWSGVEWVALTTHGINASIPNLTFPLYSLLSFNNILDDIFLQQIPVYKQVIGAPWINLFKAIQFKSLISSCVYFFLVFFKLFSAYSSRQDCNDNGWLGGCLSCKNCRSRFDLVRVRPCLQDRQTAGLRRASRCCCLCCSSCSWCAVCWDSSCFPAAHPVTFYTFSFAAHGCLFSHQPNMFFSSSGPEPGVHVRPMIQSSSTSLASCRRPLLASTLTITCLATLQINCSEITNNPDPWCGQRWRTAAVVWSLLDGHRWKCDGI